MRADFLKIAGVKSEAEFYKKFPSEEAFMKKHGKAIKKLMSKKAQVGTMIPNIGTPEQNLTPISFDNDYMNDSVAKLTGGKTSQELRDDAMYQAKMADLNKPAGFMEQITNVAQGAFSGMNNSAKNGGKFEPHMMYDPKTKKGKKAKTYKEHLALKKKGWGHTAPKAQVGINQIGSGIDYVNQTPNIFESGNFQQPNIGQAYSSPMAQSFNIQSGQSFGKNAQNVINSDGFNTGLSILNDALDIKDQIEAQKENLAQVKQNRKVAEIALQASKTMPEKVEREYVRPEDIQNTGEEFFPIYGVGTNVLAKSGININPKNKGKFTAWAKKRGMSVAEAADKVMANKSKYSKEVVKMANFAKNARSFNKAQDGDSVEEMTPQMREYLSALESMKTKRDAIGRNDKEQLASFTGSNKPFTPYGNNELARDFSELQKLRQDAGLGMMEEASILLPHVGQQIRGGFNSMLGTNFKNGGDYKAQNGAMFNGEYMPLTNPNQTKQFAGGGFVYGGGPAGQAGTQFAGMLGVNDDAGSNIGGKIGSTAGMAIGGPLGAFIGGALGSGVGDLLDRNDRRVGIEQDKLARINKEMAYGSIAPSIQAGYASHVKNGGKIESMRSGGHMRGNYIPPNPSALDTMAMGGELKTLWGGEAETVSYNPYAGGESVQFKGNSHSKRDPKTGETGIGVAYGENAVNSNQPSVEVENEPAQKLRDGGGDENLVVFGDMYMPGTNKKFKNYVSNVLNPKEAKINKRQEKVANLGLESDDTLFGQLERNTADTVLKGSDMKLKRIADEKIELSELQNAMNETFDQYGIDANKFLKNGKMVKDPMRIENSQMAKYGNNVPKAQTNVTDNITKDDFNKTQITETKKTPEQLLKEGYTQDPDNPLRFTKGTEEVIATPSSGSSLGRTPEGQSIDQETGLAGGVTMEQISELEEENPWFGKFDFTKPKVKFRGKMVHPDVLRFQKEYNKRVEGSDIKPVQTIDGVLGQETFDARFTPGTEGKEATMDEVILEDPKTATETTETVEPKKAFPMLNFQRPIDDVPLDANQLLGEYYAMATNQVQPVQAQGFQPRLRTPYDISLQDMKNDVISQSRALQRNPIFENNPAALALAQAPTYEALNKINAEEFRQNQQMKDTVYSGNIDALNKARMMNLGIFDKQAERQAQAAANTRTQGIDILSSISNKYAQNKRDNAMRKVYANMYPTFRFNDDYQTEVVQPTQFYTGQGSTGAPSLATPGIVSPNTRQVGNVLNQLFGAINQETNPSNTAKYGKKVTKNNKNSNILKAIKNL